MRIQIETGHRSTPCFAGTFGAFIFRNDMHRRVDSVAFSSPDDGIIRAEQRGVFDLRHTSDRGSAVKTLRDHYIGVIGMKPTPAFGSVVKAASGWSRIGAILRGWH